MDRWFPRPALPGDVELLDPRGRFTPSAVFELLVDPGGEEWRHKVGVAGPVDGSAKATTRLLALRGWVLKTRVDQAAPSAIELRQRLLRSRAPGLEAGVWHPEKVWGVLRAGDACYPLTLCPELVTLRQIAELERRMLAWIELIQAGIDLHERHGLGLDMNPANFGRAADDPRIHYLDDELYPDLAERDVARALVARIPEEAGAAPASWRAWGEKLTAELAIGGFSWEVIADEVRQYPLADRFEEHRKALLAPLAERVSREQRRRSHAPQPPKLTCVLADVHGNLPALEAVLDDARRRGADGYLFLGDAVGYGPQPAECVRRLAELPRAVLVRGNHDHAVATGRLDWGMNSLARECAQWTLDALGPQELRWLGELPVEHLDEGWMAVHGAPRDPHRFLAYVYELTYEDNLRWLRDHSVALRFHGHTHVQLVHAEQASGPAKLAGHRTVELRPRCHYLVNPGSVGQPRDGDPRAAYALWHRTSGSVESVRVPYDLERTVRSLRATVLPAQIESRLRTGA